jgi:hypothetical protein
MPVACISRVGYVHTSIPLQLIFCQSRISSARGFPCVSSFANRGTAFGFVYARYLVCVHIWKVVAFRTRSCTSAEGWALLALKFLTRAYLDSRGVPQKSNARCWHMHIFNFCKEDFQTVSRYAQLTGEHVASLLEVSEATTSAGRRQEGWSLQDNCCLPQGDSNGTYPCKGLTQLFVSLAAHTKWALRIETMRYLTGLRI